MQWNLYFHNAFEYKMLLPNNTLQSLSALYLKHNAYSTALSLGFICTKKALDLEQLKIRFAIFASLNL